MGTQQVEIREAREDELATMLRVTKASYAEFRDGSPDAFWQIYMGNIEEAILRAPNTERIAAFLDGELVASVLLCRKPLKRRRPRNTITSSVATSSGPRNRTATYG